MAIAARFMAKPKKGTGTLYTKTQQLLNTSSQSLEEIARASGLSLYWLAKIRTGSIKDPSANKIQRLYEYLSGKVLTC